MKSLKPKEQVKRFFDRKRIMFNKMSIFLTIHAVILISIFALRFFGLAADYVLMVAMGFISMEAIYVSLFTKAAVNKTSSNLKEVEKDMAQIREDASETTKIHRALIYAGHQIKTIQGDLDLLKRRSEFKSNGDGHHRRPHSLISHS